MWDSVKLFLLFILAVVVGNMISSALVWAALLFHTDFWLYLLVAMSVIAFLGFMFAVGKLTRKDGL